MGTYLKPLKPEDVARIEIPLAEVLPAPAGGVDTGARPPDPPKGIGHHIKFPWAKEIKAVAIIPDFEVATAKARAVLPEQYPRADVVRCKQSHCLFRLMQHLLIFFPDLQPSTHCPSSCSTGPVTARPGSDLPCDAGQAAPALPANADTWAVGNCPVHDTEHAAGPVGRVSVWSRAYHSGAGYEQL